MILECFECERDLRSGHAPSCSRHPGEPPACTCTHWLQGHEDDFHADDCPVVAWRKEPDR